MLCKYLLFFKTSFRCFHDTWSGLGVDELLHLSIVFLSSSFEKDSHSDLSFEGISFNILVFIWQFYTGLNVLCNTCQRSSSSIYKYLLYYNASMAGSFLFLTQFIRFQDLLFFNAISQILLSKKIYLVFFITLLKYFQSSIILDDLYLVIFLLHFSFYYALKCLVILIFLRIYIIYITNSILEFNNKFFFLFTILYD